MTATIGENLGAQELVQATKVKIELLNQGSPDQQQRVIEGGPQHQHPDEQYCDNHYLAV